MKINEVKSYEATSISISQLLQMNRSSVLQIYPYYTVSQKGPIGLMEPFLAYMDKQFENVKNANVNNVIIFALSQPDIQIVPISNNLASQGILENNYYTDSVGNLNRY